MLSGSNLGFSHMNDSVLLWIVCAVLVFWFVGAYNRLVRLRAKAIASFALLEGLFDQYIVAVRAHGLGLGSQQLLDDCATQNDGFLIAWQGLSAAVEQFGASLRAVHLQPLDGPAMSALSTAHGTLGLSWERLRCLPDDLAGPTLPDDFLAQWAHITIQVEMAQSEFNRLVLDYNEAIGQFPALLLAWIFDFKPAQSI